MVSIEHLRDFRVGPITMFDTSIAFIGVLLLSPVLSWLVSKLRLRVPTVSWLWFTIPVSVIFHALFHQETPLMKILADPLQLQFYIAISILLAMVYMGLRKITRI